MLYYISIRIYRFILVRGLINPSSQQSYIYEMFRMVQINVSKTIHEHYMMHSLFAVMTCYQKESNEGCSCSIIVIMVVKFGVSVTCKHFKSWWLLKDMAEWASLFATIPQWPWHPNKGQPQYETGFRSN